MDDWDGGLGYAPLKTEGEPTGYPAREKIPDRPFKPLRRWTAIRVKALADFICRDRDTGW